MQKIIRAKTNDIFNKIQKSLNKQVVTTDTTKLAERRSELRYNAIKK